MTYDSNKYSTQDNSTDPTRRNLYGRRQGRKLSDGRAAVTRDVLGRLNVPGVAPVGDPARAPVDPSTLFPNARDLWIEVGFGGGEHLMAQAAAHPDVGMIGCEHYGEGVAKLAAAAVKQGVENMRMHAGDARDVLDLLPAGSVGRAFVLYPDPWPKTRHRKRRFINPENLDAFARVLRPGGDLRVASDIPDYIAWTRKVLATRKDFQPVEQTGPDNRTPWSGWPSTRYEQKALRAGRTPCYLTYGRV